MAQTLRVFISFRSVDLPWADWVATVLREQRHEVRYQRHSSHTESVIHQIDDALKWCDRLVVLLSTRYFDSAYTAVEWETGLHRELEERQGLVCTVRIENFTVPGLLRLYPHLDLFKVDLDEVAAAQLVAHVNNYAPPVDMKFPGYKQPERPLREIVPHPRPAHFFGRETEMTAVAQHFASAKNGASTLILKGMSGVGKTAVAVEFCYRVRSSYQQIFWLGVASLQSDLVRLGDFLFGPSDTEVADKRVQRVRDWLARQDEYLLVLDGFDQEARLSAIEPLLSHSAGQILLTSRIGGWEPRGHVLTIPPLSPVAGGAFLSRYTAGWIEPGPEAEALSAELGGLPLALQQAAAFLTETRLTCAEYRTRLRRSATQSGGEWRGLEQACHLDLMTLSPLAHGCVTLLAWLAPEPLPRQTLAAAAARWLAGARAVSCITEDAATLASHDADPALTLHRTLAELDRQSLLALDATMVRPHPVVQGVVRRLATPAEQRSQIEVALELTWETLHNKDSPAAWAPHATAVLNHARQFQIVSETTAVLHIQAGAHFLRLGLARMAEIHFQTAVTQLSEMRGEANADTQAAELYLGRCLLDVGRLAEAEPLFRRVYERSPKGAPVVERAAACSELASALRQLGRFAEAEPLYREAYALVSASPETDFLAHSNQANNLGLFLREQGRFSESEHFLRQALEIASAESPEREDICHTISAAHANIGVLLRLTRRLNEAERAFRTAIQVLENYSAQHSSATATVWSGLASVLMEQGRFAEAESWLQRARNSHEDFGENDVEKMLDACDLAWLYTHAGRLEEARKWFDIAKKESEKVLPAGHWHHGHFLGRYGFFLQRSALPVEAEIAYSHALGLLAAALGPNHFRTAWIRDRLAELKRP